MTTKKISETLRVEHGRARADITFESGLMTPRVLIETSGMPAQKIRAYSTDGLRDLASCLNWAAHIIDSREEES